ncbi:LamG-like jellyroll fold domain-containing protein [Streptomyces sp. NPDC059949]|uniref:LamG-like jellyroll fold domain-containing protein n=1 Tax=Streptomyces sp. NPDC059949 TaxID=3347013 RepID=UPI00364EB059
MTDGANPPITPQPEPSPGSGGYGFPPGPPAQGGYGFPPDGGYGYPQPGEWASAASGGPSTSPAPQPDWEAMADRSADERRRKRLWMLGGAVTVLALLAGGGTFFLLGDGDRPKPDDAAAPAASASPSPSPSASKSSAPYSATVEGDATLLRDSYGKTGIRLGPDFRIDPLGKRFQIIGKGTAKSYAQSAEPVVDVSKSFTVVARVYSSGAKGSRIAISQGDGESFSFELGVNEVKGKQAWIFRVQTGDKGAAATTRTVTTEGPTVFKTATTLMASYDAEKKTIALYLDGKKAGETAAGPIWQAPGPLQLGRSKHHDIWTGAWQGALHNIRIYDTAFTPEQAAAYKEGKLGSSPKPTHAWLLTS